jgi:hypothetical protein
MAAGGVALCAGHARASFAFEDIEFWVGSGANRAALVIDWNDGKSAESLAWGFRWDGVATGADMLEAVARADDRLFGAAATFVWGTAMIGLGYDLDGDGFQTSPATAFDADGWAPVAPRDGTAAADPDDHYVEGWNTGFWAYYIADASPFEVGGAWDAPTTGFAGRVLTNGAWDGFAFAPGFSGPEPGEPVAASVPAPGVLGLVGVAALVSPRRRAR